MYMLKKIQLVESAKLDMFRAESCRKTMQVYLFLRLEGVSLGLELENPTIFSIAR